MAADLLLPVVVNETRLILIRHGQTKMPDEDEAFLDGWMDVELAPLGRFQADALAKRFAKDAEVSAFYTSPLRRARQTADRLSFPRCGPARTLDGLREIHCGAVDGYPVGKVKERHPALWEANQCQDDPNFRWPGGESYAELRKRAIESMEWIADRHLGEHVAVVTHCGLITQILGWMNGTNPAKWESFRPGNASVTEVAWGRGTARLIVFDDRTHLENIPSDPAWHGTAGFG